MPKRVTSVGSTRGTRYSTASTVVACRRDLNLDHRRCSRAANRPPEVKIHVLRQIAADLTGLQREQAREHEGVSEQPAKSVGRQDSGSRNRRLLTGFPRLPRLRLCPPAVGRIGPVIAGIVPGTAADSEQVVAVRRRQRVAGQIGLEALVEKCHRGTAVIAQPCAQPRLRTRRHPALIEWTAGEGPGCSAASARDIDGG